MVELHRVELALATDGCDREHLAHCRARQRQLLAGIEAGKMASLAELVPAA